MTGCGHDFFLTNLCNTMPSASLAVRLLINTLVAYAAFWFTCSFKHLVGMSGTCAFGLLFAFLLAIVPVALVTALMRNAEPWKSAVSVGSSSVLLALVP